MSQWYPLGQYHLKRGEIDFVSDTINATLVSTTYVYSDTHEFFDDLTGVMGTMILGSKSVSDAGVFNAEDGIITITTPGTKQAIVIWKDTGTPGTSPLLGFINEGYSFGVYVSGTQPVTWDNGPNKIMY